MVNVHVVAIGAHPVEVWYHASVGLFAMIQGHTIGRVQTQLVLVMSSPLSFPVVARDGAGRAWHPFDCRTVARLFEQHP